MRIIIKSIIFLSQQIIETAFNQIQELMTYLINKGLLKLEIMESNSTK